MTEGEGGGPTEVHILYPKKITTSEFVYPKKSLLFLAYPKKSLSPFFVTQKISASLIDPKNHFWPKFQTQKITLTPPPPIIKTCEWGPWGWRGGGGYSYIDFNSVPLLLNNLHICTSTVDFTYLKLACLELHFILNH